MSVEKPKYVVAQKKKTTTSKKLVQGVETNTSSIPTKSARQGLLKKTASNTKFEKRNQVKVVRLQADSKTEIVDTSISNQHQTSSTSKRLGHSYFSSNPPKIPVRKCLRSVKDTNKNKLRVLSNRVVKASSSSSVSTIFTESSCLALNYTKKAETTIQPRIKPSLQSTKTKSVRSASTTNATMNRRPTSAAVRAKKPVPVKTSARRPATAGRQPTSKQADVTVRRLNDVTMNQKTSTPNKARNKTMFEPDVSVVMPLKKSGIPAAGDSNKEVKPQQVAVSQVDYDVLYSQYLRTRLIEQAMKAEYENRQREGLKALARLTKEVVELQQEVTSVEVEIMKSEYEKTLSEDLHLQHNLLVPIIKNLDESVDNLHKLITGLESTRHVLPTQNIILPDTKLLQAALAKLECNVLLLKPFTRLMQEEGGIETSEKFLQVTKATEELNTKLSLVEKLHVEVEEKQVHLSNLQNQLKLMNLN